MVQRRVWLIRITANLCRIDDELVRRTREQRCADTMSAQLVDASSELSRVLTAALKRNLTSEEVLSFQGSLITGCTRLLVARISGERIARAASHRPI